MWFSLAWFGEEFRTGPVTLVTGEVVRVHRFVQQQRGFTRADVVDIIEEQYKILRAIVPLHRRLQDEGRIEVSTTPAFHPILPLIINSAEASLDRPGATLPPAYVHPEDAAVHIALAADDYRRRFGREPLGMWPAEGAVSPAAVALLAWHRVQWIASDRGVLAKSGLWGYRVDQPDELCQPYCAADGAAGPVMFFRDTALSDAIGFRYNHFADSTAAVEDFVRALESACLNRLTGDDDRVLTIALDGENAWGDYPHDGRPFLHALYDRLATDPRLKTVTFAEYVGGNPSRVIAPHPAASLARVHSLATGSWIDEPGSAPGVDLGTWIGEPEENAAWRMLSAARAVLNGCGGRWHRHPGSRGSAGGRGVRLVLVARCRPRVAQRRRFRRSLSRASSRGVPRRRSHAPGLARRTDHPPASRLDVHASDCHDPALRSDLHSHELSGPPRIPGRRRGSAGSDRLRRGERALRSASVPGDAWPIRAGRRAAGVQISLRTSRLQP